MKQIFNANTVAESVLDLYKKARIQKHGLGYIPVLMYHKIPKEPIQSQHRIFVTEATFEHQLRQLKSRGFETITFDTYLRFRDAEPGVTLPKKPIVLTFDDGYLDNYTNAWPLLKKYGFTATIYALGHPKHDHNFWDTPSGEPRQPLMSAEQLQEMATAGIEIGGHTLNHTKLTEIPMAEAWIEINESRQNLLALTGQPVRTFAYPYGVYSDEIKALVRKAGYETAVIISGGGMVWEDDLLEIFRVYVFPEDRGFAFWKKTSPWYRAYFKWKRGV
jgi:peptidoglycan/xylan/chitin deacetylase (PgdA/CDA1 family)